MAFYLFLEERNFFCDAKNLNALLRKILNEKPSLSEFSWKVSILLSLNFIFIDVKEKGRHRPWPRATFFG
jgi:hypothetical protein